MKIKLWFKPLKPKEGKIESNMNVKNELIEISAAAKAKRYPSVPDHALPKTKVNTSTANGLTKAIVSWLTLNGHFASRTSSAGRYLPKEGRFIPSTTRKGYPDITATIDGRSVYIEVKIGRDRMSDGQKKVKEEIERAGGVYFIAHSFDEFISAYKEGFSKINL